MTFKFHEPGRLVDGDIELILVSRYPGNATFGYVPAYRFRMSHTSMDDDVGNIELRVGNTRYITHYIGHIGYRVHQEYRGQHYAGRACKLLIPLARLHNLNPLWITCNPDNIASRRSCEIAGATFIEIVDLPPDTDLYRQGDRQKCRYRLDP